MAMLLSYTAAGLDPNEFWGLSPRLYFTQMQGAADRLEQEHQSRAWAVWHIAALSRQPKLPDFKRFTGSKGRQPTPQSPEVLQAMGEALARAWGATQ